MPNYSRIVPIEGLPHAQLINMTVQLPVSTRLISSLRSNEFKDAVAATYTGSDGKVLNPSWYELYASGDNDVVPLVTKSLLERGYQRIYKKPSIISTRVWNAVTNGAASSFRQPHHQPRVLDYVHALPALNEYEEPSAELVGIRADRMSEFVQKADEFDIDNIKTKGSKSRRFLAAYVSHLLITQKR